ncbi:MAG: PEP-CTERM sorting domain-containing protein [Acidobacteriaceae bacterium]
MKRAVFCTALLAFLLPTAAFANSSSMVFSNRGGKVTLTTGLNSSIAVSNSTLISFTNLNGITSKGNIGSVSFNTGILTSGNLSQSGIFAAGGMFKIVGNGKDGAPSGTLFSGTFSGPVTWTSTGVDTYSLSGLVNGTLSNGMMVRGAKVQLQFDLGRHIPQTAQLRGGTITVVVPEPNTLALLGTGALGIAGFLRRRVKA